MLVCYGLTSTSERLRRFPPLRFLSNGFLLSIRPRQVEDAGAHRGDSPITIGVNENSVLIINKGSANLERERSSPVVSRVNIRLKKCI